MRSKSPELMSEIKKYIEDYYLQNRQSPSTTKIAEAVGIARGTAYKYLVEMAEKNMIEYDGQEIRTNVTRKYSGEQTQTPIVGSIPCGSPQYEEENIEEYVSLPTAIFGKGDFFILRASGQSMIEAGIDDGDLVVVKKQVEAKEGDIVVALVDNQNTLKRYFRDDENKKIILHPENKKMKDIIVLHSGCGSSHHQRTITEDRRMRTLEGIRYLINLDSAEIQQNFAGGVAPPDKVESEVDTT